MRANEAVSQTTKLAKTITTFRISVNISIGSSKSMAFISGVMIKRRKNVFILVPRTAVRRTENIILLTVYMPSIESLSNVSKILPYQLFH